MDTAAVRKTQGRYSAFGLDASELNKPRLRPQHIADLFEPGAKGIIEQVGVSLRGLHLRMAEELAFSVAVTAADVIILRKEVRALRTGLEIVRRERGR